MVFRSVALVSAVCVAVSLLACGGLVDPVPDGPGGEAGSNSGALADIGQSGTASGASGMATAETGSGIVVSGAGTSTGDASGSVLPSSGSEAGIPATSGTPFVVAVSAAHASPPSCAFAGPGVSDCGTNNESCCTSDPVTGGTYYRSYDPLDGDDQPEVEPDGGPTGEADPATVSTFKLDKYNVTVGRFRAFVAAWKSGWLPIGGSGKHAHLNQGQGLVLSEFPHFFEPGWVSSYESNVALTDASLSCDGQNSSWTSAPGENENLPIECVNWWEAYAFCIWDGGFLPSEAEWEYAAAGGNQQRAYPWGSAAPGFGGDFSGLLPVGTAPAGAGLWGQLDLAGEVWQWVLDTYTGYSNPCVDCANVSISSSNQVYRGGGASNCDTIWPGVAVPSFRCDYGGPPPFGTIRANNYGLVGVRCAQSP
jgi:sulfatase modifying factor 1